MELQSEVGCLKHEIEICRYSVLVGLIVIRDFPTGRVDVADSSPESPWCN